MSITIMVCTANIFTFLCLVLFRLLFKKRSYISG